MENKTRIIQEYVPGKQEIGFLDRFTGSLVVTGDVTSVETAMRSINETLERLLSFTPTTITKT